MLLGLAAVGCSELLSARGCSAVYIFAIQVYVQDSVSRAMTASGAQLIVRDGAYTDSVSFNQPGTDSQPLEAAGERPGTYTVTVRKSGYQDWTRSNVQVSKGECHVQTVTLTSLLQPSK